MKNIPNAFAQNGMINELSEFIRPILYICGYNGMIRISTGTAKVARSNANKNLRKGNLILANAYAAREFKIKLRTVTNKLTNKVNRNTRGIFTVENSFMKLLTVGFSGKKVYLSNPFIFTIS